MLKLLSLLFMFWPFVAHAEFCALRVRVFAETGLPVGPSRVDLLSGGVLVESKTTEKGEVSFCDLGLAEYQVFVPADKGCYSSSINGIKLRASAEQKITIIKHVCFFLGVHTSPLGCPLLLKVKRERLGDGQDIDVKIADKVGHEQKIQLDSYNRVKSFIDWGQSLGVRIYSQQKLLFSDNYSCDHPEDLMKEITLAN